MPEMPNTRKEKKPRDIPRDIIEGLFDRRKLRLLPPDRRKVFYQLLDCFKNLKEKKATDADKEYIHHVFTTLGGEALSIREVVIGDFEEYGAPLLDGTKIKLKQALDDLYLLLLTSLPVEFNEEIKKELMRINARDFKRIMEIWERNPDGITFSYGIKSKPPQAIGGKIEVKEEQAEARIETDVGFLYVFKPDPDFWMSVFLLGREKEEAEFTEILTKALLKIRNLTERLSEIELPGKIRDVILEKDEATRNQKLRELTEKDRVLAIMILNIQNKLFEALKKISEIKSKEKEFSAKSLQQLNQELKKLEEELNDYEKAINQLENTFGTPYQPDKELSKNFLDKLSSWINENLPLSTILATGFLAWSALFAFYLPLYLIDKMEATISKGLK
jgi:hypothetical protein